MKSKLLVLSLSAAFAAPAFAEAPVQVYGVADVYVAGQKVDGDSRHAVESGGLTDSYLGFKGSESLGGGMKVDFRLEKGVSIDNGGSTGDGFDRHTTVGLEGSFGRVAVGHQDTLVYDLLKKHDVLGESVFGFTGHNADAAYTARVDNSVRYTSPSFAGLKVDALYAADEHENSPFGEGTETREVAAAYHNGPVALGLAYHKSDYKTVWEGFDRDYKATALTGGYDLGFVKVVGTYLDGEHSGNGWEEDVKAWSVGASAPITKVGTFYATAGETEYKGDAWKEKEEIYTVGYVHDLSKRTKLYAAYNQVKEDEFDTDTRTVAAGLNHRF